MKLKEIDYKENIDAAEFMTNYVNKKKPLVLTKLSEDWPAAKKWNLDYFAEKVGDVVVPLYDSEPAKGNENSRKPAMHLSMREYVKLLKKGPTDLRIFFFNILQKCPELTKDFSYPDIGLKFFKKLPVLFFGGAGARVLTHYDVDLADNMHFNLYGEKEVILFPHNQKKYLYHVPFSIVTIEEIEMDRPDFIKFPALKKAEGYRVQLNAGETLYIPSGYWHYIRYVSPSISMTLRALPKSAPKLAKVFKNIAFMMTFDNLMRKLRGQKWIDYKNKLAKKRAQ
ncbi:cupin-like domain-containing protein [Mesonia aquimarina]|uniref:cupin-like domain-containing protein n=1 Tax=Mesonia aquimarina TaxID=1504967 RepID=UPI000EF5BF86|nr:cupin-like domain-containing protein [Mesonia aquimarina]